MASPHTQINFNAPVYFNIGSIPPAPQPPQSGSLQGRSVTYPYPPGPRIIPFEPSGYSAPHVQPTTYAAVAVAAPADEPDEVVDLTGLDDNDIGAATALAFLAEKGKQPKPLKRKPDPEADVELASPRRPTRSGKKFPIVEISMLSTELFQKLIPAGTKARHKGNFVTIQGTPDQSGNIKILLPHNKQATVPVSELKPYLKTTGKVLMIDAEDPWKRHALARLTATERGNVEAVWDQFGQSGATLSLQGENALAAIIPVTSDQLEDLPKERISSSLSDGRKASGYVYQLLG